jgi:hypothetical protein
MKPQKPKRNKQKIGEVEPTLKNLIRLNPNIARRTERQTGISRYLAHQLSISRIYTKYALDEVGIKDPKIRQEVHKLMMKFEMLEAEETSKISETEKKQKSEEEIKEKLTSILGQKNKEKFIDTIIRKRKLIRWKIDKIGTRLTKPNTN